MTSQAQTVAGSILSVSAALPATYDAAGFAALSYSTVAELTDMGTIGKVYALVKHNPIADRKTYKYKSSYDNGSLDMKLAKITVKGNDPGQTILNTGLAQDASISFRIIYQDGSKAYFTAKVMSFTVMIGTIDTILAGECKAELDSDVVETVS